MRILVTAHNYPRFAGDPAGAYVRRLALGFQARGHATRVLAPHTAGTAPIETDGNLTVHRFRYAPAPFEVVGYRGDPRLRAVLLAPAGLALPGYLVAFRCAIRRAVREFRPDLIHAHWWIPAGWLARTAGPPVVVTSHGSDVRLLERSGWLRRQARRLADSGVVWTAVSRFLAADLERQLGLPPGSVLLTAMPVDVAFFEAGLAVPKAVPPRVLYAGNLVPSKGVDVLIAAMAHLRDRKVPALLRILGQGPEREVLQNQVRALSLGDRVTLHDFVPQAMMPAEYGAAAITVLPTRGVAEGLGLTLVEALLAGSAVVGTPAGGIPEVVEDGVTGLLAPDGDPDALADRLCRLLQDESLRQRLSAAGRERVRRMYSVESAVDRFARIFDDLLHRHTNG
ncbi:MAG TPA: glycosyltransferase [Gemmatimonadales bacterium]|jgi:glycosyltransferase involved in cell wall biosynthesis